MAGRPRKTLTEDQKKAIKQFLSIGCSVEEVAAMLEIGRRTIYDNFRTAINNGMNSFKCSLKRAQAKKALSGDTGMLIWLGKQYLKQKEKLEDPTAVVLPVLTVTVETDAPKA